jgi:hypothetical protein
MIEYKINKNQKMPFDILYINFFNEISEKLNIPVKFNNFSYI